MCIFIQLCCDTSVDGNYFVVGNNGFSSTNQHDGCESQVWDVRKGSVLCQYQGHSQSVNSCALLSTDSKLLVASGSKDQTLHLWDATSAKPVASCCADNNLTVSSIAVQHIQDGLELWLGNTNGTAQIWSLDLSQHTDELLKLQHSTGYLDAVV
eukprot:TRINITY_DN1082_c0_g1_i8.p2 TRINITY_DN1082_c0_g1~~TRINITY_DN1082_c0_g1_i8.p2  ORF type:complete len:154 (+),score=14.84 TRINITY_DN1082_c0_g1_i8:915-1376(+)